MFRTLMFAFSYTDNSVVYVSQLFKICWVKQSESVGVMIEGLNGKKTV